MRPAILIPEDRRNGTFRAQARRSARPRRPGRRISLNDLDGAFDDLPLQFGDARFDLFAAMALLEVEIPPHPERRFTIGD
jgi:hypothetical protein